MGSWDCLSRNSGAQRIGAVPQPEVSGPYAPFNGRPMHQRWHNAHQHQIQQEYPPPETLNAWNAPRVDDVRHVGYDGHNAASPRADAGMHLPVVAVQTSATLDNYGRSCLPVGAPAMPAAGAPAMPAAAAPGSTTVPGLGDSSMQQQQQQQAMRQSEQEQHERRERRRHKKAMKEKKKKEKKKRRSRKEKEVGEDEAQLLSDQGAEEDVPELSPKDFMRFVRPALRTRLCGASGEHLEGRRKEGSSQLQHGAAAGAAPASLPAEQAGSATAEQIAATGATAIFPAEHAGSAPTAEQVAAMGATFRTPAGDALRWEEEAPVPSWGAGRQLRQRGQQEGRPSGAEGSLAAAGKEAKQTGAAASSGVQQKVAAASTGTQPEPVPGGAQQQSALLAQPRWEALPAASSSSGGPEEGSFPMPTYLHERQQAMETAQRAMEPMPEPQLLPPLMAAHQRPPQWHQQQPHPVPATSPPPAAALHPPAQQGERQQVVAMQHQHLGRQHNERVVGYQQQQQPGKRSRAKEEEEEQQQQQLGGACKRRAADKDKECDLHHPLPQEARGLQSPTPGTFDALPRSQPWALPPPSQPMPVVTPELPQPDNMSHRQRHNVWGQMASPSGCVGGGSPLGAQRGSTAWQHSVGEGSLLGAERGSTAWQHSVGGGSSSLAADAGDDPMDQLLLLSPEERAAAAPSPRAQDQGCADHQPSRPDGGGQGQQLDGSSASPARALAALAVMGGSGRRPLPRQLAHQLPQQQQQLQQHLQLRVRQQVQRQLARPQPPPTPQAAPPLSVVAPRQFAPQPSDRAASTQGGRSLENMVANVVDKAVQRELCGAATQQRWQPPSLPHQLQQPLAALRMGGLDVGLSIDPLLRGLCSDNGGGGEEDYSAAGGLPSMGNVAAAYGVDEEVLRRRVEPLLPMLDDESGSGGSCPPLRLPPAAADGDPQTTALPRAQPPFGCGGGGCGGGGRAVDPALMRAAYATLAQLYPEQQQQQQAVAEEHEEEGDPRGSAGAAAAVAAASGGIGGDRGAGCSAATTGESLQPSASEVTSRAGATSPRAGTTTLPRAGAACQVSSSGAGGAQAAAAAQMVGLAEAEGVAGTAAEIAPGDVAAMRCAAPAAATAAAGAALPQAAVAAATPLPNAASPLQHSTKQGCAARLQAQAASPPLSAASAAAEQAGQGAAAVAAAAASLRDGIKAASVAQQLAPDMAASRPSERGGECVVGDPVGDDAGGPARAPLPDAGASAGGGGTADGGADDDCSSSSNSDSSGRRRRPLPPQHRQQHQRGAAAAQSAVPAKSPGGAAKGAATADSGAGQRPMSPPGRRPMSPPGRRPMSPPASLETSPSRRRGASASPLRAARQRVASPQRTQQQGKQQRKQQQQDQPLREEDGAMGLTEEVDPALETQWIPKGGRCYWRGQPLGVALLTPQQLTQLMGEAQAARRAFLRTAPPGSRREDHAAMLAALVQLNHRLQKQDLQFFGEALCHTFSARQPRGAGGIAGPSGGGITCEWCACKQQLSRPPSPSSSAALCSPPASSLHFVYDDPYHFGDCKVCRGCMALLLDLAVCRAPLQPDSGVAAAAAVAGGGPNTHKAASEADSEEHCQQQQQQAVL